MPKIKNIKDHYEVESIVKKIFGTMTEAKTILLKKKELPGRILIGKKVYVLKGTSEPDTEY